MSPDKTTKNIASFFFLKERESKTISVQINTAKEHALSGQALPSLPHFPPFFFFPSSIISVALMDLYLYFIFLISA
jgi:hypothetical protein